jgi:putative ABC transport system permease protein
MGHIRNAWHLFRSQKIRFVLTISGVVVGVGSLVVLASLLEVGQGILERASTQATGDDVLTVSDDWQVTHDNPDARRLERADQQALSRSSLLSEGTQVTATYGLQSRNAQFEGEDFTPATLGVEAGALDVHNLHVGVGRYFSADEFASGRRVVIAGAKVLDGRLEPGHTVRVEGSPFVVVGVLEEKPEMGPGGDWDWNNRLLFPANTYRIALDPSRQPENIIVKVVPPAAFEGAMKDYMTATRAVIDVILMEDRTVQSYQFEGAGKDSGTGDVIVATIEVLLYLTTVFSMIVGGINIMNIMLVTVVERTREIGLRRALGARKSDILRQFVAEAVMVTLIGALVGVGGALAVLAGASLALTEWVTAWPFRVEPWSLVLGVLFSSVIGLVFGVYPAWRASRLDPVEALRSD